ncbi:hypothetical protein ADUPG1_011432 [Aduncisulcus paluster]|uniref:Uncharacterized protein n=1 Tax=Aduncisulcus paluster TaxID=2918883 RepID=A0ABQ5JVL4_9EUKA|nr:hypothetical protein ADUPG1_011432 [Aduncisulcus paluster]
MALDHGITEPFGSRKTPIVPFFPSAKKIVALSVHATPIRCKQLNALLMYFSNMFPGDIRDIWHKDDVIIEHQWQPALKAWEMNSTIRKKGWEKKREERDKRDQRSIQALEDSNSSEEDEEERGGKEEEEEEEDQLSQEEEQSDLKAQANFPSFQPHDILIPSFSISYNGILEAEIAQGIPDVSDFFKILAYCETVDLSFIRLDSLTPQDKVFEKLQHRRVKNLNLSGTGLWRIEPALLSMITQNQCNSSLSSLVLSHNQFLPKSIIDLIPPFKRRKLTLDYLNLDFSLNAVEESKMDISELLHPIIVNNSDLRLSIRGLSCHSIRQLSTSLSNHLAACVSQANPHPFCWSKKKEHLSGSLPEPQLCFSLFPISAILLCLPSKLTLDYLNLDFSLNAVEESKMDISELLHPIIVNNSDLRLSIRGLSCHSIRQLSTSLSNHLAACVSQANPHPFCWSKKKEHLSGSLPEPQLCFSLFPTHAEFNDFEEAERKAKKEGRVDDGMFSFVEDKQDLDLYRVIGIILASSPCAAVSVCKHSQQMWKYVCKGICRRETADDGAVKMRKITTLNIVCPNPIDVKEFVCILQEIDKEERKDPLDSSDDIMNDLRIVWRASDVGIMGCGEDVDIHDHVELGKDDTSESPREMDIDDIFVHKKDIGIGMKWKSRIDFQIIGRIPQFKDEGKIVVWAAMGEDIGIVPGQEKEDEEDDFNDDEISYDHESSSFL